MEKDALAWVERIGDDGISISLREGKHTQRQFISWSSLGLARSPDISKDAAVLQWKLYCVDCNHKKSRRDTNHEVCLRGRRGQALEPQTVQLQTGFLYLKVVISEGALLKCSWKKNSVGLIQLASPLSVCLTHRQGNDRGHSSLCGTLVSGQVHQLSKRRKRRAVLSESADAYAARWGSMVEMEAVAASIDCESRLLFNTDVRWEIVKRSDQRSKTVRGHFNIPFHFAKRHSLKFRGLIGSGGETASGWLCIRAEHPDSAHSWWSRHAHVIGASIPGHGASSHHLVIDDDDLEPDVYRKNGIGGLITVTFEVLAEDEDEATLTPPENARIVIEYLPKAISYQVMHIGLADINQSLGPGGSAQPTLLARDIALCVVEPVKTIDTADLNRWGLHNSQEAAVRQSLAQPLHLVHGPAGTGKTRTAAALMGIFAERNAARRRLVLFCAPTNRAVDSALLCMSQLCDGVRLLRVYSADAERADFPLPRQSKFGSSGAACNSQTSIVADSLKRFALHWRCHANVGNDNEPSKEACETRQAYKRLRSMATTDPDFDKLRTEYVNLYNSARALEVRKADIIFATCVSVRRNALLEALWKDGAPQICQVILDEAAQCVEPEALCPMALARNAEHVIMFGDHCQLRPIIQCAVAAEAGMDVSLFERLVLWGEAKSSSESLVTLLNKQYRMHPSISKFPRMHFYRGLLQDAECTTKLEHGVLTQASHQRTLRRAGFLLWDVGSEKGDEVRQSVRMFGSGGVGSRANQLEAKHAANLAAQIAQVAGESSVAVLSWYNSQVALIKNILADAGHKKIHVGTISTAQGSEWEYVILSAVRTQSSQKNLGILSDPNVLNVALTRSILGLVIVCDRRALDGNDHWRALAKDSEQRKLVTFESPGVMPLSKANHPVPQRISQAGKVPVNCRACAEETSMEDVPSLNSRKLSDADFSELLRHSGKLASYGRSERPSQNLVQSSTREQNIIVAAHKGVLFGAPKKAKPWRMQIQRSPSKSNSASPSVSRRMSVSRSRSRRRAKRQMMLDEDWMGA